MFRGLLKASCPGARSIAHMQQQKQIQHKVLAPHVPQADRARLFTTRPAENQQQPDGSQDSSPSSSSLSSSPSENASMGEPKQRQTQNRSGTPSLDGIFDKGTGGSSSSSSSSASSPSSSPSPSSSTSPSSKPNNATTKPMLGEWFSVIDDIKGRYGGEDSKGVAIHREGEPFDFDKNFEELWKTRRTSGPLRPAKPSDGRVCDITKEIDVSRGFQSLNSILARNNVRNELRLGERYEKPNQQRRRLRSERHRKRFAEAVRKKVQLVMELKSRGA